MTDYKTSDDPEQFNALNFEIEDDEPFSYADFAVEDWLAFVLFWLLAITLFSQFLSRYVFSSPLGWTEELARYQLVALGFIGSCMGVRKNTHIFVSLFHRWMPASLSLNVYRFIALCNLLFLSALAYFAWQIIPLLEIHKMASLDVPVSVLYSVVFGGLVLMIFRSIQHLFKMLTSGPDAIANNTQKSLD
ncbi:TRAP transporter small permease [Paraglaciecola sp. L3A3]|uniref:TRAP transporter small permease n=1 Tax=Paraglaciecola sp. L3A3 TaxID=2686358 RepID=UPI00131B0A39|nr:TRAP transporter small permease [Paraglaciecola sp. L3A3]